MLKIGAVKWRGKCSRHPMFDPFDGEGGIRGGCARCTSLLEIAELHRKMIGLMRTFSPPVTKKRPEAASADLQIGLFE